MKVLAVSGSLRVVSSNTALLYAAAALAPPGMVIEVYQGIDALPHFNPDHEDEQTPAVTHWRSRLQAADGVIFSTPEYAHGLPGVLKNALDWVVGSGELMRKPFAIFQASPQSHFAPAQLAEIIQTMDARFIPEASLTLSLRGKHLDKSGILSEPEFTDPIHLALAAFMQA